MSSIPSDPLPWELNCQQLQERLDSLEELLLVDCREPVEHQFCRIEPSQLIPMGDTPGQLDKLRQDPGRPIVIYCHHGIRSLQVVQYLRQQGIDAQSLAGGIDAWSQEIDPQVPRY